MPKKYFCVIIPHPFYENVWMVCMNSEAFENAADNKDKSLLSQKFEREWFISMTSSYGFCEMMIM